MLSLPLVSCRLVPDTMMNKTQVKQAPREPVVRLDTSGKRIEPPSGPQTVKVSRADTDGAFEVIEIDVAPGGGPPLHYHPGFDEAFYVTEGVLTLRIGDRIHELSPRSSALVPAGTIHTWKNRGSSLVRFLQMTAPGSMEGFLEAFAADPTRPVDDLIQLAEKHGTNIIGPPLE